MIVVKKSDRKPSPGAVLYRRLGLASAEAIEQEQRRCWDYDWSAADFLDPAIDETPRRRDRSGPKMRSGGCQCGAMRYTAPDQPVELYVCHCLECKKQSASAFGISFVVRREDFRLTRGEPRHWTRATDSGGSLDCHFCPECGTRVWHDTPGSPTVTLKGGSLDEPPDLSRAVHIWTRRLQPGVSIPAGARQFPGEPD